MAVTLARVDLERLGRRYTNLQLRFAALQGRARELQERRAALAGSISLAKARIELAPQAAETFKYLQEKAHARAVGEFEDLLSAFVADVVPDAGRIHLELGTERGAPALDILLDNGGDLENILEGNGGGLTNVVVTGLGFSALSRTANRQLMVLDEPDCWLKSMYVPSFTKVIAEVANPRTDEDGVVHAGCQTLMISHNDIGLMDEGAHIQDLRIEKDLAAFAAQLGVTVVHKGEVAECAHVVWVQAAGAGKGHVEVRYREDGMGDDEQNALTKGFPYIEAIGGARAWSDDMPGVRWVEVVNLRRHVFSRLELSPGLNVLTGDINGGKSTLYFTALRALAYGETDDTMIRHGADSAIVRLGLENEVVLEVVRSRKGSPKVLYRRYEGGTLVNEGRQETRGGVPSFISEALKIERIDELDIQLRSQKQPVFLLNETPARRAQLLSVGRESGLLQELIEKHRLELRRDRENVKREEAELNQVTRTLTALAPLSGMSTLVEILDGLLDEAKLSTTQLEALRQTLARLEPLAARSALLARHGAELSMPLTPPPCHDVRSLTAVLERLERGAQVVRLPLPPAAPVAPTLADTAALRNLGSRVKHSGLVARLAGAVPALPPLPPLVDTGPLAQTATRLARQDAEVLALVKGEKEAVAEERNAQEALHGLMDKLGACPVCSKPFKDEAHV